MELIEEKRETKSDFNFHCCTFHKSLIDDDYCKFGCKVGYVIAMKILNSGVCPYKFPEEKYYEDRK